MGTERRRRETRAGGGREAGEVARCGEVAGHGDLGVALSGEGGDLGGDAWTTGGHVAGADGDAEAGGEQDGLGIGVGGGLRVPGAGGSEHHRLAGPPGFGERAYRASVSSGSGPSGGASTASRWGAAASAAGMSTLTW